MPRPSSVSLAEAFPEVAAQLDAERSDRTAAELSSKSSRRVWWRCGRGHSWPAAVQSRTTKGSGCPYCEGRLAIPGETSFAAVCQETLLPEWDAVRNTVDPDQILPGATMTVWWRCAAGSDHRWDTTPKARYRSGTGCPYCSRNRPSLGYNLLVCYPEISAEYDVERNEKQAHELLPTTQKFVHWVCPAVGHRYRMRVANRTSGGQNCPVCSRKRITAENGLAAVRPHLVEELHPTKNGDIDPALLPADSPHCVMWWRCQVDPTHDDWEASTQHRGSRGFGCPSCSGQIITNRNRLSTQRPDIAATLDVERSGFTADQLHVSSGKRLWWTCPLFDEHRWRTSVCDRTQDGRQPCPFCSGRKPWSQNNLEVKFPHVARELKPEHNDELLATELLPHSSRRIKWECQFDASHLWDATVNARTSQAQGCPHCSKGRRTSIREIALRAILRLSMPDAHEGQIPELGRLRNVDVLIPSKGLVVEYDGAHYHRGREERDGRKIALASAAGWTVVRVRERPLEPIGDHDVSVASGCKVTQLAAAVFDRLTALHPDLRRPADAEVEVAATQAEVEYRRLLAAGDHRKAATTRSREAQAAEFGVLKS